MKWKASALVLALSVLSASAALAQSDPQKAALASTLFDDATKAMDQKNFAEACPKLEKVVELIPDGVGARETLAECYEGAGKLASAFGALVGAEGAAMKAGQSDRAQKARDKQNALKPRVATLTLEVPPEVKAVAGLSIKRDGADVSNAEFGLPVKLDKGEHVILVNATGKAPWERRVQVNDGDRQVLKIELGGAGAGPVATPPGGTPPGGTPPEGTPPGGTPPGGTPGKQTEQNFFSPLRIAGLAIGIAGVGGVAAGIGLGMNAKSLYDESNEEGGCDPETNACSSQSGVDLRADAVSMGNIATGVLVAGGVLAAGGIVMFAIAPSETVEVSVSGSYIGLTTHF